jgi:ribosomal protein L18E
LALALCSVEPQVRTEHEVHRVVAQPVLGHADACAEATELMPEVARRVEKPERMHIAQRLHDAQVNVGKLAHRGSDPEVVVAIGAERTDAAEG